MKKKIAKIICALMIALFGLGTAGGAYAAGGGGWFGEDDVPEGGGGGGGGVTDCTEGTNNWHYVVDCTGTSWIYYKAIPGKTAADEQMPYSGTGKSNAVIPESCYNGGAGGFWHYGVNGRQIDMNGTMVWTSPVPPNTSVWDGHHTTLNWGYKNWGDTAVYQAITLSSPQITKGGLYKAYEVAAGTADIMAALNEAQKEAGVPVTSYIPRSLWGFCWWPGMGDSTKYKGIASAEWSSGSKSTLWQDTDNIAKTTLKTTGSSVSVTFKLGLKRTEGTEATKFTTYRRTSIGGAKSTRVPEWTSFSSSSDAEDDVMNFTEDIAVNSTVCWGITFYTDGASGSNTATEEVCVKVKPKSGGGGGGDPDEVTLIIDAVDEAGNYILDPDDPEEWMNTGTIQTYCMDTNGNGTCDEDEDTFKAAIVQVDGIDALLDGDKYVLKGFRCTPTGTYISSSYSECPGDNSRVLGISGGASGYSYKELFKTESSNVYYRYAVYEKRCPDPASVSEETSGPATIEMKATRTGGGMSTGTEVYAKPGDQVNYQISYNPVPQPFYNKTAGDSTTGSLLKRVGGSNCGTTIAKFGDAFSSWSNGFTFTLGGATGGSHNGAKGDATPVNKSGPWKTIQYSDIGKKFEGTAAISTTTPTKAWTKKCTGMDGMGCEQNYLNPYIETSGTSASADVYVPHNFNMGTELLTPGLGEDEEIDFTSIIEGDKIRDDALGTIVYAGETKDIMFNISLRKKHNSATDGDYATKVINAKEGIRVCIGKEKKCTIMSRSVGDGGLVDPGTRLGPGTSETEIVIRADERYTITVPDIKAGSRICVQSGVFPASSGDDTNWENPEGNGEWAWSPKACYIIAKRPNLQAWGGNVYANNPIDTSTSVKKHVSGHETHGEYKVDSTAYSGALTFGSWSELGLISNSTVNGMASGAALGYDWGSSNSDWCSWVPLTFSNATFDAISGASCRGTAGGMKRTSATSKSRLDVTVIEQKYIYGGPQTYTSGELTTFLNNKEGAGAIYKGNNEYYYKKDGAISVGTTDAQTIIPKATTQIVHSGVIYIDGSLVYGGDDEEDAAVYTNFSALPKLILYANDRVEIACDVAKIHAVIVAPKVTTCSTERNGSLGYSYTYHEAGSAKTIKNVILDSPENTNQLAQLKVFGAIITKKFVANRTYGGGSGPASVVGAEILNFDPTLYRFGVNTGNAINEESVTASTDLTMTYVKELAPRY